MRGGGEVGHALELGAWTSNTTFSANHTEVFTTDIDFDDKRRSNYLRLALSYYTFGKVAGGRYRHESTGAAEEQRIR